MNIFMKLGVAIGMAGLAATAAGAVTLAPARYYGGLSGNHGYSGFVPNSVTFTSAFGTKTASSQSVGGLRTSVVGASTIGGDGVAEAMISFKFIVISALPGAIDLIINGIAQSAGSGNYFGESGVEVFGSRGATVAYAHSCNASPGCNSFRQVFSSGGAIPVRVQANEILTMLIYARGGTFGANSSFNVFADPTIMFDPAYAKPAGAYFEYSGGIPNPVVAGVPELMTWSLMLVGFGAAGIGLRRTPRRVTA